MPFPRLIADLDRALCAVPRPLQTALAALAAVALFVSWLFFVPRAYIDFSDLPVLNRISQPAGYGTDTLADMYEIDTDVAEAIRTWQEDREASVRYAAAAAYLKHAEPDAATVRGVIEALREGDVTERRKAVWDAQSLAFGHRVAREALEQALEQDDMIVRLNAVLAL